MDDKQQIEEMAKIICPSYEKKADCETCLTEYCYAEEYATVLFDSGFQKVNGDTSDGYHTFNELYHHRAVLFSIVCNNCKDIAWKSKKHNDGTMYEGMFIVGIETPQGQATYHYNIEPYWDMFEVKELSKAPVWDGHTPQEAIERLSKL